MLAPGDNLLEVENLRVSFDTERGVAKVLDGVNLTIRRGEIIGLVVNPVAARPRWRAPSSASCRAMRSTRPDRSAFAAKIS